MSRQLSDLQSVLQLLVAEHERMLKLMDEQQLAVKKLDVKRIEELAVLQENTRLRISGMDSRRRLLMQQISAAARLDGSPTIARLAEAFPQFRAALLTLRDRLRALAAAVSAKAQVAGKIAGAVLGHLNTVVRVFAGATEQAGLYSRQGVPVASKRIGVIEAVG